MIERLARSGAWSDLPDDMEETLLCWRREVPPTPPIEDQLRRWGQCKNGVPANIDYHQRRPSC